MDFIASAQSLLAFPRGTLCFARPTIRQAVYEDNEGVIEMATDRFSGRRKQHINVKRHIVRDAVDEEIIKIDKVKSGEQRADAISKAAHVKKC